MKLVFAVTACLTLSAAAPSPAFISRFWRTQDGLPENRVRSLAQTPDGYLWIGTTGGLARFDGVRFTVYNRFNTPAILEDNIRALAASKSGELWIATDGGGLLRIRGGEFERFGPADGLTSDFVAGILVDRSGAVWAVTNRGLFRRSPVEGASKGRFVRFDDPGQSSRQAFFCLYETSDGVVLAGGQGGLFRLSGEEKPRKPVGAEDVGEVFRIRETRDGAIWLNTTQGMRVVAKGHSLPKPDLKPLDGVAVGAILEDSRGTVWVGTLGSGIYLYPSGAGKPQHVDVSLPDSSVLVLLEDREGAIWAGTADGLARLTEPDVGIVDRRSGLDNDNVVTVYCGHSGDVWLTTITGKAFRYRDSVTTPFLLPEPAAGLRLLGAAEDRNGALWFGTDNQGAIRLQNGAATRFTMREGLRNNGIQFFHTAPDGSWWIGTTSGISRWDGNAMRNYYVEDGLSYGWVRSIVEDANRELLVGTDRGLNRFRNGRFVQDPEFQELSRDRIWALHRDRSGTLWVGTRSAGLVRIRRGEVRRITTREGLLSNAIFQILETGDGRLWMSGPAGVSSATLEDLNKAADGHADRAGVLSHRVGGGQESTQINGGVQPAGCVAHDGEVWFPGVKGAIHFQSRRPPIQRHLPVRIEGVYVDGVRSGDGTVEPGRKRVRIEFTSCSLRAPESVSFRYKLEPYDSRWLPVTAGVRAAEYDNLPPGAYRFQVIARDESPGDNSSRTEVSLNVKPYFYQTAWFFSAVAILLGAGVAGIFFYRERRARETYNLRLAERTRIAREMHDTLVQGCVGVSTLIEAAAGAARTDQDQMLECLDDARVHLRLTIDEARQALTDLRHDSFEHGLPGALREWTGTMRNDKGIPIRLHVTGEAASLGDADQRALLLVIREAVRNAATHGRPQSIEVSLRYTPQAIEIDVQDDGIGFAAPEAELADRGHFGILGMRERIEQLGGSLEVCSEPGAGTTVSARVPLPPKH